MDNRTIFARNLQNQMDINKKSRKDVSEALGVSYYTYTDWIKGKKYPRIDKIEALANYFGIPKSELIEDQSETPVNYDGLSEKKKELIDFALSVPEDKASMVLRVLKSIVEDD